MPHKGLLVDRVRLEVSEDNVPVYSRTHKPEVIGDMIFVHNRKPNDIVHVEMTVPEDMATFDFGVCWIHQLRKKVGDIKGRRRKFLLVTGDLAPDQTPSMLRILRLYYKEIPLIAWRKGRDDLSFTIFFSKIAELGEDYQLVALLSEFVTPP